MQKKEQGLQFCENMKKAKASNGEKGGKGEKRLRVAIGWHFDFSLIERINR